MRCRPGLVDGTFFKGISRMKIRRIELFQRFVMSFPFVFVLLFLGYLPVHYDLVIHTDNIVGEGICQTFICPTAGYAAFYKVPFYFGSELKKATVKGYHYDVKTLTLITSDVSEFDIKGIDSYYRGIHLSHFDPEDILQDGEEVRGNEALLSSKDGVLHIDVFDSAEGTTLSIGKEYIPIWFWIVYITILLLFTFIISIFISFLISKMPFIEFPLYCASAIMATVLAGCFFCGSLPYVTYANFLLNWLFLFSVSLLLNAISFPFLGTVLTMGFTLIWYIANYFVILFRNKPIMPADLKAIKTAAEVMGGYSFTPTWKMIIGIGVVILYASIVITVWNRNRKQIKLSVSQKVIRRVITAIVAVVMILIGVNSNIFKSLDSFAWDMVLLKSFHEEGMVLTYLKSMFNSSVKRPEGYSREIVEQYLKEYQTGSKAYDNNDGIRPTNIIMIMDEAFSDLRDVGLDKKIDVMPFIDELDKNTIKGDSYVSVFGGGTCNSEFEALTGNSLSFFGAGAYPYTENITDPLFSLASFFSKNGYQTNAFHANEPQNWNRNMVYPNLGFDKFNSIEEFEQFGEVQTLHGYPSDMTDYQFVESISDQNITVPRFMFDVTLQNHSGYERWLDVERDESVEKYGSNLYPDTQVYLSLIRASDDAIKQLVEKYENSDEPTMIIYFGDHQPSLPNIALNEVYTTIESNLDFYKTRFFIWTNYESEEQTDVKISTNFFPWLILERGGFELPPFIQMLKEVHEKYPVITSQGVMDSDGNIYTGVAEILDDPLIKKYQYVQYANMFDEIDPAWFEVN